MFRKNEFMAALALRETTVGDVAKSIGIDPTTLYRKINGKSDFMRKDIIALRDVLKLNDESTLRIFFS